MIPSLATLLGTSDADAPAALTTLVSGGLGVRCDGTAEIVEVDYACDSPATGGLYRVLGTDENGVGWSLFCKQLQHVRHWPHLIYLPEHLRADFAEMLPWRAELQLWEPAQLVTMPEGLRAPHLHAVIDLGDDRVAVWQEDVAHDHGTWDLDRYARAGRLLGRWNARSTTSDALAVVGDLSPGYALREYAINAVQFRGLKPLEDDGLWSHPWLLDHADLRASLRELGTRIPALLDSLDAMTQCSPHGDASPQNLLCPLDDPDTLVAIDLSFRSSHALGFDLGQLLVGGVHAGLQPASAMPEIARTILTEYVAGLHDEGITHLDDEAARGFATSVLLRSGFDGFLFELLEVDTDEARKAFDERVRMARFISDQFRALVG